MLVTFYQHFQLSDFIHLLLETTEIGNAKQTLIDNGDCATPKICKFVGCQVCPTVEIQNDSHENLS